MPTVAVRSYSRLGGEADISGVSLDELVFEVSKLALDAAGVGRAELDGVVTACSDVVDGRAISTMALAGAAAGYMSDSTNLSSAGEHAFVLGYMRILSGTYRTCLVVGWSKTSEGEYEYVSSLQTDPRYERDFGLSLTSSWALQASRLAHESGRTVGQDRGSPVAWPLMTDDMPNLVDGVVAFVLGHDDQGGTGVRVRSAGCSTEPYSLGERVLGRPAALDEAADMAYTRAGISDPARELQVAEVFAPTPYHRDLAVDGLRLASTDGGPVINAASGQQNIFPGFAAGLWTIGDAVSQLESRDGEEARAVAHATSGLAGQFQTVLVLEQGD